MRGLTIHLYTNKHIYSCIHADLYIKIILCTVFIINHNSQHLQLNYVNGHRRHTMLPAFLILSSNDALTSRMTEINQVEQSQELCVNGTQFNLTAKEQVVNTITEHMKFSSFVLLENAMTITIISLRLQLVSVLPRPFLQGVAPCP